MGSSTDYSDCRRELIWLPFRSLVARVAFCCGRAAADTYYVVPPDSIAAAVEQIENEGAAPANVKSQYMQQSPRHNR